MPAKGGRRGRKHKGTSHVVPAVPAVPALAKPAPYSTLNYSKFDKLVYSDEESEHNGIYTPAQLGLDHPFGETEGEPECGCACVHCRERAEAAEEAAAAAAAAEKQRSISSKSIAVHNASKSDFDFGKALKSQSVKAKIAEGKANRAHGIEDSTLRFPVTIPREDDVAKVKSGCTKPAKKSGHNKAPKSITSDELDDVASRPTFDICIAFVQEQLPPCGCSDRIVSNIVEKLTSLKQSKSSREPMVALVSIFAELRIGFDSTDLIAYSRRHVNGRKKESKPKDAHLPDPLGFQALMEKQGLANSNTTFSFTSLSGNHQQHTQPGMQGAANVSLASSEANGESSSEKSDDIPPLMEVEEEFQQNCFGSFALSPGPSKTIHVAKSPARPSAAKSAATKPAAHKQSPAKPSGKTAPTASKPSLARLKSPAAAKVSQPHHVTTVSDDDDENDDDDEDMPGLVSDNNVSDEEDDYSSDESEAPPSLISEDALEDDTQHEAFAASNQGPAAKVGKAMESAAKDSGNARVPAKGGKQASADSKAESLQAPPAASTEGKAATSAAAAEPMFRPVSRGFLAQQTSSLEAKQAQADSTGDAVEDAIRLGLKEAGLGTPFSFDHPIRGGSKASSAASSSKAGTASKADGSVPASQQPVYPFPQEETTEEYSTGMGIGGLSCEEEDWLPSDSPDFDPTVERRRKYAADDSTRAAHEASRRAAAADEARRRAAAADEAMKQLLEEEERDKAEAAAKAEKVKKEKQKTKKAKQKAKKKAQQDKASSKLSQVTSTSAQPSKASQADSSESEEEEERERFSLHDSRFASLVDGSDGLLAGSWGPKGAPSSGQGPQKPPPLLHGDAAAASTAANSGNEEEGGGRDNTMMQFGGAYSFLSTVGRGSGPASEKSQSSQDSSSRLPSLPVLPPGESPLRHVKNAAYSQAGSSNQVPEPQHVPLGLRPGAQPGMEPTYQSPSPLGLGGSRPTHLGPSAARMGPEPPTDPAMWLVLEDCRNVVQEMEEASGAGDKGRLQEALKEAVNWLSKNGSNPDVAANSAQVRRALHDAKAKLKEFGSRGAGPQARPPTLSSAAASRFAQPPSSMPAGAERAPGIRQALLQLAGEARRHPFRDGQPPPPPLPRAGQPPPPPPPRVPPGPPGGQAPAAVPTSSQPGLRPYLHPYQPPPGGIQGPQGPFRQPYPQQSPQEPYRQPYPGGLSPYRPVAGGRGVGPAAGRGPAARSLYTGPGQGSTSGFQQAPTAQEGYSAYRQWQAQPRPPAMPTSAPLPPQPGPSHAASYGSDYGSLDRSSMSGSEAMSPVKRKEARYEAKTKYVQPTPFGAHEQPSFDDHDDTDCVVCMDDVRSTIFVPCGHCLCCQSCAETVVQKYKHCPVCSTSVDGFCAIQQ